eukprot:TRINITY_DN10918_c0_g1_i1.p1 TRINITY_DN10918_c0_g1~~TRINITY_DN10918_c0_g1_i1.p1  ORF type:complete len:469 (+),score=90.60 TRINITY_DN10918_c0_g1_i1:1029-2435(+)
MYKAYIEPDLETAHIKIQNKFNPFSGFQSPSYILKSVHIASEEHIRSVLSADQNATTEETYDIYLLPPGEDSDTCQSYLRMRNRAGRYSLMFEEWVVDKPFIISPRITFEVSVRLLGGLMALGYTITTILKRTSTVFSDEKITVKIDQLEQYQRKYLQVQGKDRTLVKEVGTKLGLDGSYIPHSYIEQIQLEKLTAKVTSLPEDLKSKLIIDDTLSVSPIPSFSWIAEAKPGIKNQYSKSWSRNGSSDLDERHISHLCSRDFDHHHVHQNNTRAPILYCNGNGKRYEDRTLDSPKGLQDQGFCSISDQIGNLNERLDKLITQVTEMENKITSSLTQGQLPRSSSVVGSFGNNLNTTSANGIHNGHGLSVSLNTSNSSGNMVDMNVIDELRTVSRGQRHLVKQLDVLSGLLREDIVNAKQEKRNKRWTLEGFLGGTKTNDSGLAIAASLLTVGVGGLIAIFAFRTYKTS